MQFPFNPSNDPRSRLGGRCASGVLEEVMGLSGTVYLAYPSAWASGQSSH